MGPGMIARSPGKTVGAVRSPAAGPYRSGAAPTLPWMTLSLGLLCLAATGFFLWLTPWQQQVTLESLGASPAALFELLRGMDGPSARLLTPLLSLFIHSGWLHLLGNLAYLWVFGWPLERRLGHWSVAALFLLGGLVAQLMLAQRLPSLEFAVIGASGAVSTILGAYLGLFPRRTIGLWLPLGLIVEFVRVPALLVIGSWFGLQLLYAGLGPITWKMAFWTHLAGFSIGLMLALLLRGGRLLLAGHGKETFET
jgi:membrane associated rhomboid family serine protease